MLSMTKKLEILIHQVAVADLGVCIHLGGNEQERDVAFFGTIRYLIDRMKHVERGMDQEQIEDMIDDMRNTSDRQLRYTYHNCYDDTDWFDKAYVGNALEHKFCDQLHRYADVCASLG